MTAGMLKAHWRRLRPILVAGLLPLLAGCQNLGKERGARKIPQFGVVDPDQTRELQMVTLPPYVVEPPDELDVSVRPASPDLTATTVVVQADGNLDLGFAGDVYVAGLNLRQVEQKIAQQLN